MAGKRLFNTETKPGGITEKWYSFPDGRIERHLSQNAEGVVGAVKGITEAGGHKSDNQYLLGSVPIVVAQQWARECGYGVGTRDWLEYAKKKLMDANYRDLSTGVKI